LAVLTGTRHGVEVLTKQSITVARHSQPSPEVGEALAALAVLGFLAAGGSLPTIRRRRRRTGNPGPGKASLM
jgi:hypothetical protein